VDRAQCSTQWTEHSAAHDILLIITVKIKCVANIKMMILKYIRVKEPGHGVGHPHSFSGEVQRRVKQYLYSLLGLRGLI
jgi:hypothetical protein